MQNATHHLPVVTDADFDAEVLGSDMVTVAKFTAEWCPPCHVLSPIFEGLAREMTDKARFVEVDADSSPLASARFNVRGLPTVLYFRNGEVVGRLVGAVPRKQLEEELTRALK